MRRSELSLLFLLAGLVVFSRFWILGEMAFKADSMEFYKLALRNQSIIEFWKNPPWLNQIPLNETLSLLMVKAGLPATPFVVRLPFALMGLLAAFFVWHFALRRFGTGTALFVLALTVFNPYALYHARDSYHYSGTICFSAALFSVFWLIRGRLQKKEQPGCKVWILWFVTAAVTCHMHMGTWPVAGLQALLILIFGLFAFVKNPAERRRFLIPFVTGSVLLGIVMSRWIFRAVKEAVKNASGGGHHIGYDAKAEFMRLLPAYFAGENIFAIILLFIFIGLSVLALFGASDCTRRYRSLAWICSLHIAVLMIYVAAVGGGVAKITYFSGVWPHFILLAGVGAYLGSQVCFSKNHFARRALCIVLAGCYLAITARPVYAIIHLAGSPTPFYKINDWVLKNLPEGTPILTDRWLEPWNELAIHNPDNINYTFTVPDEPIETYRRLNWRKTAEQFFEKYPEASFLELGRGKYETELGKWIFPQTYFARSAAVTNEAALVLRRYKVLPIYDFADANTNRVVTRIYYNTPEDLVIAARREGREVLRLYGTGWGYAKPGWQQGDFRDYRILNQSAPVDLYNLKEVPVSGSLEISAAAANKPKTVSINGVSTVFSPGRIRTWTVPLTLQPGLNAIPVVSPSGDPLFVSGIRWQPPQR